MEQNTMNDALNLLTIERRAWRAFLNDGLWDIFLGLLLVAMAAGTLVDETALPEVTGTLIFVGLEAIAFVVALAGKRWITRPRLGQVKFGPRRARNKLIVVAVLCVSVVFGLAMTLLASRLGGSALMPGLWVVNAILVFGLMAYFLDYGRLYVIGALYALVVPVDYVLKHAAKLDITFAVFGLPGLIIVAMGLVVLVRFMRTYPVQPVQNA
jgi:hypothetical protein